MIYACFISTGYLIYYIIFRTRKPRLAFNKNHTGFWSGKSFNSSKITSSGDQSPSSSTSITPQSSPLNSLIPSVLLKTWRPPFLLHNCHVQNLFYEGIILQSPEIKYTFRKLFISELDNGVFAVDVLENPASNNNYDEIILVLPGITGKSPDPYIKRIVNLARNTNKNTLVACMINRGYDGLTIPENASPGRLQNACNSTDLTTILKFLAGKYGEKRTRTVAFSYGGIQTRIFLGRNPKTSENEAWYPRASICASCPLNLKDCVFKKMEGSIFQGQFYNRVLCSRMSQLLERHGLIKKDSLKDCTSLRQIDDRVTSKVWGYKGWEDFYSDACLSENEVLNVKIPLIFLNSLDDPLIHDDDRMLKWFEKSDYVLMAHSYSGGHCAFLTLGWLFGFRKYKMPTYYEQVIEQFLQHRYN